MDLPATQICENDFTPTQKIFHSTLQETTGEETQVGVLSIGSNTYPIKIGINKIGRHPDCNIILNDQTVSKKHAEIEANSGETSAWICDLNSSNKTKLNNSLLRPGRCYELKHGNIIEFGTVRAIYKVNQNVDDSVIPDTPSFNRLMKQQTIIPGTPDSSLNNSSALGESSSIIPGTQADNKDSIFRHPTLPLRISTSDSRNHSVQDSSIDNSLNVRSSLPGEKENVGETNISIHDMETQELFKLNDENSNIGVHDVETQKLCSPKIESSIKATKGQEVNIRDTETQNEVETQENVAEIHDMETQSEVEVHKQFTDIHDMETQNEIEEQRNVVNIHDVETQHDVDIHDVKTPKKGDIEDVVTRNNSIPSTMKSGKPENRKDKSLTMKEKSDVSGKAQRKNEVNEEASCFKNTRKFEKKAMGLESSQKSLSGSQDYLQLSLSTNFEGEHSELDRSRNLLGSQNLLDLMDINGQPNEVESELSTAADASHAKSDKDVNEKSTDDENIFDAATQINNNDGNVTQRVKCPFKDSLVVNDSDDTDDECVFQRYSRKDSQDSEKPSKSQMSDSDSVTDEEDRFMEIALEKRRSASGSFEMRKSLNKETGNDTVSSKDSDDLFNMLTQPVKSKNKDSSLEQSKADNDEIDSDIPTQVIDSGENQNNSKKDENIEEVDDLAPTQILLTEPTTTNSSLSRNVTKSKMTFDNDDDITEMEDNTATQILSGGEKTVDTVCNESPITLFPNAVEENSVEDIDYEMAPTQLISEIKNKKYTSSTPRGNKNTPITSKTPNKVNLNDTIEKNLNEMFDDTNEQQIENQPQISTQVLENMLQSQSSDASPAKNQNTNIDGKLSGNNTPKKSVRGRRKKSAIVPSPSNSILRTLQEPNLKNINTDSDSQNSDNYFSTFTSTRKCNVIGDSQDSADPVELVSNQQQTETEETSTKIVNAMKRSPKTCTTPSAPENSSTSKSVPEVSSTPTSSRKLKIGQPNTATIPEDRHIEKNKSNDTSSNNEISHPFNNGEQVQKYSIALEDDDDDILAGLPEVKIAGTLSNPASPTSSIASEYRININDNEKQVSVMIAPKKRATFRKKGQRSFAGNNVADTKPYHTVSKPNSLTILGSSSNSLSNSFDIDKIIVHESDDGKVNKNSRNAVRKATTTNTRRSKDTNNVVTRSKSNISIDSQEKTTLSPSIQCNGRTRNTRKVNVDCSSVFQVARDAPVEKAAAEPVNKTVSSTSRVGKRSHSMVDASDIINTKRRKEDVGTKAGGRRNSIARSQSANILDYVTRNTRNSPANVCNSNDLVLKSDRENTTKAIVKVVRLSPRTPTGSLSSSTPTELLTENNSESKSTQSRHANVASSQTDLDTSSKENKKTLRKTRARRSTNQKMVDKIEKGTQEISFKNERKIGEHNSMTEQKTEEISDAVGEESQEVEMIMNGSLREQTTNSNVAREENTNESKKSSRGRKTRKGANTSIKVDVDKTKSTPSDSCESDNAFFEVPTLKTKRAKMSKNISNVTNTTINESTKKSKKSDGQRSRSTRSQKPTVDSSTEENKNSTMEQTSFDSSTSGTNISRTKQGRKRKVESYQDQGDTTSSEINSSIETSSTLSTPTRMRRSMLSSFASSTPSKTKHKILFTGISNSEYSKLLTKLGASQVEDPGKCTVLVTDKVRRTVKFLCALGQSVPIVSVDWLINSEKAGHFVDLEGYILKDPTAEAKFGFKLESSLKKSKGSKLLEGYTIVLTPNISAPPLPELKSIIVSCGGKALVRAPQSWPQKAVIVSREEDLANAKKFLAKAPKTVTVQSTEFILTGILRQVLNFTEFKLQ